MILCHIKYNFPDISDDFVEHTSLMMIREPIERIISHYEYFIRKKNNIPLNDLSTDQLHKFCIREDIRDTMTDYLSHSKSETEAIEVANEINFLDDIQNINYLFESIKKFYERECGFLINTITVPVMNKSEGENKQSTEVYQKIKEENQAAFNLPKNRLDSIAKLFSVREGDKSSVRFKKNLRKN